MNDTFCSSCRAVAANEQEFWDRANRFMRIRGLFWEAQQIKDQLGCPNEKDIAKAYIRVLKLQREYLNEAEALEKMVEKYPSLKQYTSAVERNKKK